MGSGSSRSQRSSADELDLSASQQQPQEGTLIQVTGTGPSFRTVPQRLIEDPIPQTGDLDTALVRAIPQSWLDKYSIGIFEIDAQHKKLFDIIEQLQNLKARNFEGAGPVILGCVDYTRYHFDTEEAIMKLAKYPGLKDQQAQHKIFVDRCRNTSKSYEIGELTELTSFGEFLLSWLIGHIQSRDADFGEWLLDPAHESALKKVLANGVVVNPPKVPTY
eukprot:m51a1_g10781 putative hemerythrin-like metal-binding protein (219) ;mRNA; f:52633-53408